MLNFDVCSAAARESDACRRAAKLTVCFVCAVSFLLRDYTVVFVERTVFDACAARAFCSIKTRRGACCDIAMNDCVLFKSRAGKTQGKRCLNWNQLGSIVNKAYPFFSTSPTNEKKKQENNAIKTYLGCSFFCITFFVDLLFLYCLSLYFGRPQSASMSLASCALPE